MMELIEMFRNALAQYPDWGVWGALAVVLLVLAWVVWRIVKIGMTFIVAGLLMALVGFTGYVIFTS